MQAHPHRRADAHASSHVVRSRDIGVQDVAWWCPHAVALPTAHAVAVAKAACTTVFVHARTCHRQGSRLTRNPNKRLLNQSHACLEMPSHIPGTASPQPLAAAASSRPDVSTFFANGSRRAGETGSMRGEQGWRLEGVPVVMGAQLGALLILPCLPP